MSIIRDAIDCCTWRERKAFAHKLWLKNRPAIDGESIAGGWGRARGLLGGAFMGVMLAQQSKTYTARDYVQSGLIHQWDGIENAGFGVHDNSATEWTDIAGDVGFTLTSRASWSDTGLVFDNTSAYADAVISNPLTIECVFQHTIANNKVVVLNCGNRANNCSRGIYYNQVSTEGLGFYFDGNGQKSTIMLTDGTKKSIAVTWTSNSYNSVSDRRFLNSVLSEHTGSHSSSWGSSNGRYCIGGMGTSGTYNYGGSGVIYALRFYNRALTAAEIAANYAVDKARFGLT